MKSSRRQIESDAKRVFESVVGHIKKRKTCAVVQAPPGSGKTYLLAQIVDWALKSKRRVAVAAQTNAQADDICERLHQPPFKRTSFRFLANGREGRQIPGCTSIHDKKKIPTSPCVVVGTAAKWGAVEIESPFDLLLVDEAWQMPWSRFMPLGGVADTFVLIGDPGQIPPIVSTDASRWETTFSPPHVAAPEIVLQRQDKSVLACQLPASRRLSWETVEVLKPFYRFSFTSWAGPGDRGIVSKGRPRTELDRALGLLSDGAPVLVTLRGETGNGSDGVDTELAAVVAKTAHTLLQSRARSRSRDTSDKDTPLAATDIGIAATHRVMNDAIRQELQRLGGLDGIRVDTPERWQGLECKAMLVVHPLSGVLRPSSFHFETGRLCVMLSRHKAGTMLFSRARTGNDLEQFLPLADQAIGQPDVAGAGHARHLALWRQLRQSKRIVEVK